MGRVEAKSMQGPLHDARIERIILDKEYLGYAGPSGSLRRLRIQRQHSADASTAGVPVAGSHYQDNTLAHAILST
jgi:hypothetical protein